MSVGTMLGLDPNMESVIADAWQHWAADRPQLAVVEDPRRLRVWLHEADSQLGDDVVHDLAWLASSEGGDDTDAALGLAWLLLPGACFVARQLRTLSANIDQLVAGELWILVRTFPLQRRKVVVNVMRDLRSRVLASCQAAAPVRGDRARLVIVGSVDSGSAWTVPTTTDPTARDELVDVLDWALETRVICAEDRRLLLCLVNAAQETDGRVGGPGLGLLSNEATELVGLQLGVCGRTVRRHAMRCIDKLAAAAPAYTRVA